METSDQEKHTLFFDTFLLPVEVAFNKKLDKYCRDVFCLIRLLDNHVKHCTASNTYMANILDITTKTVSDSITTLKEQRYVELLSFDGRTRVLQIQKSYKTEYRYLVDEVELRLLNLKSAYTEYSKQLNKNDLPRRDVLGRVEGSFTHNKSKEEELQISNHSVINCENSVSTRKLIKRPTKKEIFQQDKLNRKPVFRKEKKQPTLVISSLVQEILDYWDKAGFTVHAEGTQSLRKTVEDINSLMQGTLFQDITDPDLKRFSRQKFNLSDIKLAIDNHYLRAFSNSHQPEKQSTKEFLQKMMLCNFFYNPRNPYEHLQSEFLVCYSRKVGKVSEAKYLAVKDTMPNVTKMLTDWYKKTFAYKINGSFSIKDRNTIVKAGKSLKDFLETNKTRIRITSDDFQNSGVFNDPVLYLAHSMTRMFDEEVRNNDTLFKIFEPTWFASELTLTSRLPKFLKSEGVMK